MANKDLQIVEGSQLPQDELDTTRGRYIIGYRENYRGSESIKTPFSALVLAKDHKNDIEDLNNRKVGKSDLISINAQINQLDQNKVNKEDVPLSMLNKGSVVTITDLPTNATKGDAYFVEEEGYIYQYDGLKWNKTIYTAFPSDIALKGGLNKTIKEIDNDIRLISRETDIRESENIALIKQVKRGGQYNAIEYEREIDSIYMAVSSNLLRYYKSNEGSVRNSKEIQVKAGDIYSITACVGKTTPPVVGFSSSFEDDRVNNALVKEGYNLIVFKEGTETTDGYYLEKFDFIIPEGVSKIVIQGRNKNHPSFIAEYDLFLEKKEPSVKDVNTSVFTTKAESEGFWNNITRFIQGTLLTSGIFVESLDRIISEDFIKRKTSTFSASVANGYEFTVICFDENYVRLGYTGISWAQQRINESFIDGTVYYRVIIRKSDETLISPKDLYDFQSAQLVNLVWDRLISESNIKNYIGVDKQSEKIADSKKIEAPDYSEVNITTEYMYSLYDSLLGNYEGKPHDDSTDNQNYYRVSKKFIDKDHSNTYDIFTYEFLPLGYTRTVFFSCLLHGTELITSIAMYELMKHIVYNDTDSPVLKYMRENVRIILLPVANPWGLNNKKYGNINGVNPNRNYPYYWDEYISSGTIWDVKGAAPFSEKETTIIRDIAVSLAGELDFTIDYHTGEGTSWKNEPFFYYDSTDEYVRPALIRAGTRITADYIAEYGVKPKPEVLETARSLKSFWFNRCLGVPSATIEFSPTLYSDTPNDTKQLTAIMWNYLRYWTELFSLPKFTSKGGLGVEILTENEYKAIPAKSYKKIYVLSDKGNAKKIGDIDF